MGARRYVILDVFTSSPLEGNPLAVVLDCDGLDTAAMLKIAGEFNLSETVFVLPPEDEMQTARIRIFTPAYEMPFAGHPTVGTAVALAVERGLQDAAEVVLGENIGPVRCVVSSVDGLMGARFEVPKLPERLAFDADTAAISEALGLEESEIGMDGHEIAVWSAGVPYVTVPVSGLAAAGKVFGCACSRREIADALATSSPQALQRNLEPVYPGTCRNGIPGGRAPRAWRFRVCDEAVTEVVMFDDRWLGPQRQVPAEDAGEQED